jgi:hypothetical protein
VPLQQADRHRPAGRVSVGSGIRESIMARLDASEEDILDAARRALVGNVICRWNEPVIGERGGENVGR